jgi:hypothetical protein
MARASYYCPLRMSLMRLTEMELMTRFADNLEYDL